ncbi:hypothetical protein [Pseudomonas protegens]|uniref:hypothetical protein n=1 Tax=Pseudomonas protegens TaxID=380021 RepID=UPI001B303397|nr:hypothetical protein [Pseudomonas protegens]MBP5098692.1 hypothetical protein [Pseudomonas protegens]QEN50676.1 hypothetical protein CLA18_30470 [Pseudomonas protegens]QTU09549.1 hypothetical protein HUT25_28630 [Pseudomonas protegens]QTU15858.1 hypothetical protein HUT23_29320 [Pseudomonas protegens]QTU36761.1 hypothetical protein HUT24_02985 [Pseudomonas protegens]
MPAALLARATGAFGSASSQFGNMGMFEVLFPKCLQRRVEAVVNGCGQATMAKTVSLADAGTSNT